MSKMSKTETYQKKELRQHIYDTPDTYAGGSDLISETLPICDHSHREHNLKHNTNYKSLKITPDSDVNVEVRSSTWNS